MIKIKANKIILFSLFVVVIFLVASCSKAECKVSSDCIQKTCAISKCENKKCVYTMQQNCCGNRINETFENGKPGDKCTCPADYGKCEGKGQVKKGLKTETAVYAHYLCNDQERCVLGVESQDVSPQNFLDTASFGYFKTSNVIKYNKPFDINNDNFELKVNLDDGHKDLVLPVKITNVKILFNGEFSKSELLIAEQEMDESIDSIGSSATMTIPLNLDYKPREVEESGLLRYSIDFSYTKNVPKGKDSNGNLLYDEESARERFTSPTKQIFLVKSG